MSYPDSFVIEIPTDVAEELVAILRGDALRLPSLAAIQMVDRLAAEVHEARAQVSLFR